MRDLDYSQLLAFEQQIRSRPTSDYPVVDNADYQQLMAAKQLAPELLWHSELEMMRDFDYIMNHPLVMHWLFDSAGINFRSLALSPDQKLAFYRDQTNLFIQAVLLLTRDESVELSRENFTALKQVLSRQLREFS